jgi:hypothetical protein
MGFAPGAALNSRWALDRAQACRGASIRLAARGDCLDRWASFRVAALVLEVWAADADDRGGADARVNYVGGSL